MEEVYFNARQIAGLHHGILKAHDEKFNEREVPQQLRRQRALNLICQHIAAGVGAEECPSSCPEIDLSHLWPVTYLDVSQTFHSRFELTTALISDLTICDTAG